MATLDLEHIDKSFGSAKVLHDIHLSVRDREFVVFVGPSVCGKSTLLRIIAGLEEATSEQIVINGPDVSTAHPLDRGISMVFQSYALYPHLSVFEKIAFPLRVAKLPEPELRATVAGILRGGDRRWPGAGPAGGGRGAVGRSGRQGSDVWP